MKRLKENISKYHRLIWLELKKIGLKKMIFVMLVLTISMICIHIYAFGGRETYKSISAQREFMEKIGGSLTEEKYNKITQELEALMGTSLEEQDAENEIIMEESEAYKEQMSEKGIYGKTKGEDISILETALYKCNLIINMEKNKAIILERAQKNLKELGEGDTYSRAYNKKVIDMLNHQKESKIMDSSTSYEMFFLDTKYYVFMIMALVIIVSGLFTKEKESGMMSVIRASKEAAMGNFISKYAVMILVSIFITVYFQIVELILYGYSFGFSPGYLDYPARMINIFNATLYNYTVWQLIIVYIAVKMLIMIFLGNIILLISLLSKNSVVSMSVSSLAMTILVGVPYFFMAQLMAGGDSFQLIAMTQKIKRYMCTAPLSTHLYYSEYHAVNFFGIPISEITFNCMICGLTIIILTVVSAMINKKGAV